jgi:hypothetical protein
VSRAAGTRAQLVFSSRGNTSSNLSLKRHCTRTSPGCLCLTWPNFLFLDAGCWVLDVHPRRPRNTPECISPKAPAFASGQLRGQEQA